MAIALLVSEQYIKDTTVIDENVDMKLLRDVIELCQDKYIIPLVGTGIYNEFQTQILAGTLTALNTTLLDDYVAKAMKWWVQYEGVDVLTYKFNNKSVSKKTSENSQPIDMEEIRRLMEKFRTNAEMYSQRITQYLLANLTSYPLYSNPGNTVDTIHPKRNSYTTGIYLGNSYNYKNLPIEERFGGNIDLGCTD